MAAKLVNTVPGEFVSPFVPGRTILAGLRSTSGGIDPTKTAIDLASTAVFNSGYLPEVDPLLSSIGATVAMISPEKSTPITGLFGVSQTVGLDGSSELDLNKIGSGTSDICIYAITVPINPGASVLGHLKFRVGSWASQNPFWCNLLNEKGLYFGLEHGPSNTAAYTFLRDDGTSNGTIVVGGPQASPNAARPGQIELSTLDPSQLSAGWKTLAVASTFELFILFNLYTAPYTVEIWIRRDLDNQLIILKSFPVSNLGNFVAPGPSALTNNTRVGPSNQATLYFGFSGANGEVLEILDWGLYPDYKKSVAAGTPLPYSGMNILPNGPVTFSAEDNLTLDSQDPARWLPTDEDVDLSQLPKSDLYYQPGKPNKALLSRIYGTGTRTGYQRREPRLETRQDGAMFEAVVSGSSIGDVTPMGIGISDGAKFYRLLLIEDSTRRTIGLIQSELDPTQMSSFAALQDKFDWTKQQLIRLTVDRRRRQILLYAAPYDGTKLASKTLSVNLLPNASFETDSNADGWSDNWGDYGGSQNPALDGTAGNVYHGLKTQTLQANGAAVAPRMVLLSNRTFVPAGTTVTLQARMKAQFGRILYLGWKGFDLATGGGEIAPTGGSTTVVATGAYQLVTLTFSSAFDCFVAPLLGLTGTPPAGATVWIDAAQFEFGSVATDFQLTQSELTAPQIADETTPALIIPINQVVTDSGSAVGRMVVGFLSDAPVTSQLNVSKMLYLARYLAWESRDGKLPDDASLDSGIQFTSQVTSDPGGSSSIDHGVALESPVAIVKNSYAGGSRFFSKSFDLALTKGFLIDFKVNISSYTDAAGVSTNSLLDLGAGLRLYVGGKLLQIGFFDCGLNGKKIGILPGSGSASDIVNQTALGVQYSAPVDWTQEQNYRVLYKPYDSLKVFIGSVLSDPAIVIPWAVGGFDLPLDGGAPSIQFGHFGALSSSTSRWSYLRWGASDGYDISVKQSYPDGLKPYLFGGKLFSSFNFYEA